MKKGKKRIAKHRYDGSVIGHHTYKDLTIHAAKGLHESAYRLFTKYARGHPSILVLGSGTGAFDQRLIDEGHTNIVSVDINTDNYTYKDERIRFLPANLNSDFSKFIPGKYDTIIALELIEHLYSPDHFLNECSRLLKKDGFLVLSTPNIHNRQARINSLLFGYPSYYIAKPKIYDHVSPIFDNILEHLLKQNRLGCDERVGAVHYYDDFRFHSARSVLYYITMRLLSFLLSPLMLFNRQLLGGVSNIYIIRRIK